MKTNNQMAATVPFLYRKFYFRHLINHTLNKPTKAVTHDQQ